MGGTGPMGSPGAEGPLGLDGMFGLPGAPGRAGTPGQLGRTGETGHVGQYGQPGLNIVGPMGIAGPIGPAGYEGKRGTPGLIGPAGLEGHIGLPGPRGELGFKGQWGHTGIPGHMGVEGKAGKAGANGQEFSKVSSLVAFYSKYTRALTLGNFQKTKNRPIGAPGPAGPAGAAGAMGVIGNSGVQGETFLSFHPLPLSFLSPPSLLPLSSLSPSFALSPSFPWICSLSIAFFLSRLASSCRLFRSRKVSSQSHIALFSFPPCAPAPSVRRGLAPDFAAEVEHSHLSSFDALSPFAAAPLSIISGIWISSAKQLHQNTRTSIRAMQRSLVQLHADGHTYLCNRS